MQKLTANRQSEMQVNQNAEIDCETRKRNAGKLECRKRKRTRGKFECKTERKAIKNINPESKSESEMQVHKAEGKANINPESENESEKQVNLNAEIESENEY